MRTAIPVPVVEPGSPRRGHPARVAAFIIIGLVILIAALLIGVGWYYSDQLLDVTHRVSYTTPVLAAGPHSVTLARSRDTARPGIYGMDWHGGHAVVGAVTARSRAGITRSLLGSTGSPRPGTKVVLTASVYRTPADLKLPYRTISFADPLGSMPAWYVPATGHLWVIIIHGYRSQRSEGIRVMPVYHALGMPVLDIAYRNDAGAPESRDHLYHLGGTEWKDAQAAAQYALAHGATGLVMMGYSMGGNITEAFLHHSRYASRVRAAVLDSPAIDWSSILDLQARQRHLPNFLTVVGERVIAYRLGASSLDAVNNAVNASELKTPTLLYYGTQDSLVPHTVFASFIAHARSGTLTTVKVPGAGHTESWNVQPHRYDTALRTFLTRIIGFKTAKQHR